MQFQRTTAKTENSTPLTSTPSTTIESNTTTLNQKKITSNRPAIRTTTPNHQTSTPRTKPAKSSISASDSKVKDKAVTANMIQSSITVVPVVKRTKSSKQIGNVTAKPFKPIVSISTSRKSVEAAQTKSSRSSTATTSPPWTTKTNDKTTKVTSKTSNITSMATTVNFAIDSMRPTITKSTTDAENFAATSQVTTSESTTSTAFTSLAPGSGETRSTARMVTEISKQSKNFTTARTIKLTATTPTVQRILSSDSHIFNRLLSLPQRNNQSVKNQVAEENRRAWDLICKNLAVFKDENSSDQLSAKRPGFFDAEGYEIWYRCLSNATNEEGSATGPWRTTANPINGHRTFINGVSVWTAVCKAVGLFKRTGMQDPRSTTWALQHVRGTASDGIWKRCTFLNRYLANITSSATASLSRGPVESFKQPDSKNNETDYKIKNILFKIFNELTREFKKSQSEREIPDSLDYDTANNKRLCNLINPELCNNFSWNTIALTESRPSNFNDEKYSAPRTAWGTVQYLTSPYNLQQRRLPTEQQVQPPTQPHNQQALGFRQLLPLNQKLYPSQTWQSRPQSTHEQQSSGLPIGQQPLAQSALSPEHWLQQANPQGQEQTHLELSSQQQQQLYNPLERYQQQRLTSFNAPQTALGPVQLQQSSGLPADQQQQEQQQVHSVQPTQVSLQLEPYQGQFLNQQQPTLQLQPQQPLSFGASPSFPQQVQHQQFSNYQVNQQQSALPGQSAQVYSLPSQQAETGRQEQALLSQQRPLPLQPGSVQSGPAIQPDYLRSSNFVPRQEEQIQPSHATQIQLQSYQRLSNPSLSYQQPQPIVYPSTQVQQQPQQQGLSSSSSLPNEPLAILPAPTQPYAGQSISGQFTSSLQSPSIQQFQSSAVQLQPEQRTIPNSPLPNQAGASLLPQTPKFSQLNRNFPLRSDIFTQRIISQISKNVVSSGVEYATIPSSLAKHPLSYQSVLRRVKSENAILSGRSPQGKQSQAGIIQLLPIERPKSNQDLANERLRYRLYKTFINESEASQLSRQGQGPSSPFVGNRAQFLSYVREQEELFATTTPSPYEGTGRRIYL